MTLRLAGLATLLLLASCEASRPPAAPPQSAQPTQPTQPTAGAHMAASCTGTAQSLTVSDRGIGGTGVGSEAPVVADRGIGGTGVTSEGGIVRGLTPTQTAERGGGGTGIVGVLTGFRSLCLDGVEVALDGPPRITVDGVGEASETLRVGEVAVIEARGSANDLRLVSLGVRHEVSGPITAVAASGDAIEVAGQHVLVSPQTRVAADLRVGGWVAVSGLRDPTGAIRASRLDGRAPGDVLVAGVLEQVDGGWRIGGLRLRLPPAPAPGADRVVLSGDLSDGVLRVRQVSDDPLLPRRSSLQHMFVESYPALQGKGIKVAEGIEADLGPSFGAPPPSGEPVVLELINAPANALLAVGWREAAPPADAGHGKTPQVAPLMQTPALTPPVAPAVVAVAPTTTTVTTTTVAVTSAAVTTPVATTTPVTTTTTTVTTSAAAAASSTTATSSSSDSAGQSSATANSTGGAAPASTGTNAKGSDGGSGGSPSGGSPAPPTARSPPAMIGEGQIGAASPPAPSKGAGGEGGSDGPGPPAGKSPGGAVSEGGGAGNGTAGGSGGTSGGGTGTGTGGTSGTGTGTGTTGTGTGGIGNGSAGNGGTGTGTGSGTGGSSVGSGGTSGPPAPPVGGVGGTVQGGKKGDAPGNKDGKLGAAGSDGGRDGKHGRNGHGPAPAPHAPSHGAGSG